MRKTLIWDLPTRIFHGLLVAGFMMAAGIAFLTEDEGPLFSYHAIAGLIITLMVLLRVVYGFVGSRYARFASFAFKPSAVLAYMRGVLTRRDQRYIGHNPGSAYAILALLALVLALAVTGILLGTGTEGVKEVHEVLAVTMIVFVVLHIAGVFLHTVRHRENITASMIHGRKMTAPEHGIPSSRPLLALVFVLLITAWTWSLLTHHQGPKIRIPLLGLQLDVGDGDHQDFRAGAHHDSEMDDD